MLSWSDIRGWNVDEVSMLSIQVINAGSHLRIEADELTRAMGRLHWEGDAANAARADLQVRSDECFRAATQLDEIGRCVAEAAARMYPIASLVRESVSVGAEQSFAIADDGAVTDSLVAYTTSAADAWEEGRHRLRLLRELTERVHVTLRRATEIDEDTAASLLDGGEDREQISQPPLPAPGTAPANAAFWASLTPIEQAALLDRHPGSIGNLDGIPAAVRDDANREVLRAERVRLEGVAKQLAHRVENNVFGGLFDDADAGLKQTLERLDALDAITRTLEKGDRQLLVLDNSTSDETLAAIGVGDVHTATHVAVFVPGFGSDVADDLGRYDGDIGALKTQVQAHLPAQESVACVTWMNYQTPEFGMALLDPGRTVATSAAAATGGQRLTSFLDGLDAARSQDPHLSLLGHSYGSLTAAMSVRDADANGVDALVALGSPGLDVRDASALSVPPGSVFVGEAPGDMVADLGAFGVDPSGMDGVRLLATDEASNLKQAQGHSEYLTEGTLIQRDVALVVAGRTDELR
ncbi:MAG: alpha/beta hydrolase [Rhodococcus sp. (in: high G+C Gram-positive bacteria)]